MQPPNQSLQCLRRSNTFVFCLFLPSDSVALPAFSSCLLFSPRWECSFRDASGSSPAAGGTGLDHHRCTGQDKTPRERKTQIAVHPGALFQVHLHSCQFCQSRELSYWWDQFSKGGLARTKMQKENKQRNILEKSHFHRRVIIFLNLESGQQARWDHFYDHKFDI